MSRWCRTQSACLCHGTRVDVDVAIGQVKVELEKPVRFPVFVRTFSALFKSPAHRSSLTSLAWSLKKLLFLKTPSFSPFRGYFFLAVTHLSGRGWNGTRLWS